MRLENLIKSLCWIIIFSLNSCIEVGKMEDIGDGFKFGYYDNTKYNSNVFYNDTGLFSDICYEVRWNSNYILGTVTSSKTNMVNYFLVNKREYIKRPRQMESDGIIGPISFDSLDMVLAKNDVGDLSKHKEIK
jgi:hypothetical protein